MNVKKMPIFALNYHIASELCFYLRGHPQVYALDSCGRPSMYDFWIPQGYAERKEFLFITYTHVGIPECLQDEFKNVKLIERVPIISDGKEVVSYNIYRGVLKKGITINSPWSGLDIKKIWKHHFKDSLSFGFRH